MCVCVYKRNNPFSWVPFATTSLTRLQTEGPGATLYMIREHAENVKSEAYRHLEGMAVFVHHHRSSFHTHMTPSFSPREQLCADLFWGMCITILRYVCGPAAHV